MQPQDYSPGLQQPAAPATPATPQLQVIDRLRSAVNVLITVSNSPSVDQLAAAIAFTLLLNKMGKHATAVFSGDVPSTLEFLQPENTIEKNTDSLRDFIVSLDKNKADKLRYKVEENVVKIFITPYKTSLSESDLIFSQGDFNVDAIVALGVSEREQLDQAIVAHGRILHDATVITVSAGQQQSSLGAINWQDSGASSLCEMLIPVGDTLQPGLLDGQIATAYLTGIVSKTERFRNEHTTPKVMTMAAQLMAAGANQQLIAASLDKAVEAPISSPQPAPVAIEEIEQTPASNDGELMIEHSSEQTSAVIEQPEQDTPQGEVQNTVEDAVEPEAPQNAITKHRMIKPLPESEHQEGDFAGGLFAAPHPGNDDGMSEPNTDPLTFTESVGKILTHAEPIQAVQPTAEPDSEAPQTPPLPAELWNAILPPNVVGPETTAAATTDPTSEEKSAENLYNEQHEILTLPPAYDDQTLHSIEKTFASSHVAKDPDSTINDIEEAVRSPHLDIIDDLANAQDAVMDALSAAPYDANRPAPLQALNASPLELPNQQAVSSAPAQTSDDPVLAQLGLTGNDFQESSTQIQQNASVAVPQLATVGAPAAQAPPPIPPPLVPSQR